MQLAANPSRTAVPRAKPQPAAVGGLRPCRTVCRAGNQPAEMKKELSRHFAQISLQLDEVLNAVKTGQSLPPSNNSGSFSATVTSITSSIDEADLVCDENGCVLIDKNDVAAKAGATAVPSRLHKGRGWSLGIVSDSISHQFDALVGGQTWSVGLTRNELQDFILALQTIRATIKEMAITTPIGTRKVMWDTPTVRMEGTVHFEPETAMAGDSMSGDTDLFSLTFLIGAGRMVRAQWSEAVVADMLEVLDAELPGFSSSSTGERAELVP